MGEQSTSPDGHFISAAVRAWERRGCLYVLRSLHAPLVKIGTTINASAARFENVARSHGADFEIVAFTRGGGKRGEQVLHEKFDKRRLYGEWFVEDEAVKRFTSRLAAVTNLEEMYGRFQPKVHFAPSCRAIRASTPWSWPVYWRAHLEWELMRCTNHERRRHEWARWSMWGFYPTRERAGQRQAVAATVALWERVFASAIHDPTRGRVRVCYVPTPRKDFPHDHAHDERRAARGA
jgi:hypothetical protein